ncbi:MAG: Serine/threonine-protein phosphatase catalytic subunit [Myxococcaceae bacterium]|nr:Serine/threonine-protein phosphatase catalytic subunit [Myxococcaceae bacterium]
MVSLSADPRTADKQMRAILFYLTTFGHIDGEFDASEKTFIRHYVERLVTHRVRGAEGLSEPRRSELVCKYTKQYHDVFKQVDLEVQGLFSEAVAHDEEQNEFVHARLKLRCFETFQGFDAKAQEQLMESIDTLLMSDGEAHPAELKFRAELSALLETDLQLELLEELPLVRIGVGLETQLPIARVPAKFFAELEQHYSSDPDTIKRQVALDQLIMKRAISSLEAQRARGAGKLSGKHDVREFAGQAEFLDGHVVVCPPKPGRSYDLTVLGDLHGCYSCLKAAITQARFFDKVAAFRKDPERAPEPKLVLLGDYIDRGMFSINGVLRSVLSLYLEAPEHVVVLRGNHEYFVEYNGNVYGGVKPSEAIDTLRPHVSVEVFREYIRLFDALPNMMLFDRTLLVHGGIPRDTTIKQKLHDLSGLNDPDLRFQMMWSDPSTADVIPAALQEQSARFAFGRLQAQRFLQRLGCAALIRGHDKILEGFRIVYDDPSVLLCTLFSSGGEDNHDLPASSSYRNVRPMALTITHRDGETQLTPWRIAYEQFNEPAQNRFYETEAELAFVG